MSRLRQIWRCWKSAISCPHENLLDRSPPLEIYWDSPARVADRSRVIGFSWFTEAWADLCQTGATAETWTRSREDPAGRQAVGGVAFPAVEQLSGAVARLALRGRRGRVCPLLLPSLVNRTAVSRERAGVIQQLHHGAEGESVLIAVLIEPPLLGLEQRRHSGGRAHWGSLGERRWRSCGCCRPLLSEGPGWPGVQPVLKDNWEPHGRGVEQADRPGWFFTGRRRALSQLVAWLTSAPAPVDNIRVITGGPGSGKSAVLARLVTMSDLGYRPPCPCRLRTIIRLSTCAPVPSTSLFMPALPRSARPSAYLPLLSACFRILTP